MGKEQVCIKTLSVVVLYVVMYSFTEVYKHRKDASDGIPRMRLNYHYNWYDCVQQVTHRIGYWSPRCPHAEDTSKAFRNLSLQSCSLYSVFNTYMLLQARKEFVLSSLLYASPDFLNHELEKRKVIFRATHMVHTIAAFKDIIHRLVQQILRIDLWWETWATLAMISSIKY